MNFEDIKKLTAIGNYEINIDLEDLNSWLERQKSNNKTQAVLNMDPDFQRGHVWTEEQQINYVEFTLRGGKQQSIYFNCVGWMGDYEGPFVIVDGKQRLTAILKFINNEIKAFGQYCHEFGPLRMAKVDLIININNLKTEKEVLKWYLELNSGGTPHTEKEIERVRKLYNDKC